MQNKIENNMRLSGYFQRYPKTADEDFEHIKRVQREAPQHLLHTTVVYVGNNRPYNFDAEFFQIDRDTGAVLGQGKDVWGHSMLSGQIFPDGTIEFQKNYINTPSDHPNQRQSRFPQIIYQGRVESDGENIVFNGTYHPDRSVNYDGIWQLKSPMSQVT